MAPPIDKGMDGRGIYRAIYVSLWDDSDFRKLTPNEKLVFLFLRTNPLSNMPVIYKFWSEPLLVCTGISKSGVERALKTLCRDGWIEIEEGVVWVKKGLRFDPAITLSNEKHLIAIKNIILGLPRLQIVRNFIDFYKINMPYPIPSRYPMGYKDPDKDKDKEKEKEEEYEEKEKPKVNPFSLSTGKEESQNQSQEPKVIRDTVEGISNKLSIPKKDNYQHQDELRRQRENFIRTGRFED